MDFFGIIYDMKNGKKVPYSKTYFDTLFAAKLGGSDVKTITGVLPLTFSTSENKLRDWTIYGNNTPHNYSAEGTLPLTCTTHTAGTENDWTIYGNAVGVGERTANLLGKSLFTDGISVSSTGEIISNKFRTATKDAINVNSNTAYLTWETDANQVECMVNGYDENDIYIGRIFASPGAVINTSNYRKARFTFYTNISMGVVKISEIDNLIFIEGSTPPLEYIPYGYQIPITISQQGQPYKTYDIYIGDSPLTEGETVSKTSTGIDVELFEGENTVGTTLYNKPSMSITGLDYVGVGEYVNGQWQIPLAVTCDRNLFNIYGNMAYGGRVRLIDYNIETSSVTGEMSANSFFQLGFQNAIVKGDETFVISFDKTTAGTAELLIVKGEGSAQEVIETFDISAIKSYRVVFDCEESFGNIYPRLVATEAATQTFEHLMIKKASDKGGFVPYGAKYECNVPIDAPLTDGQSVTDTLTINTFEGENVLDTTLDNKPEMEITYKGG